ncbi:NAD(P)/FAD-dependent oxidoreductase [Candidatus Berkelbacteria bacterium]|nr:NAD(P)/FAD-dependent oxidoreductase [Candidatus Berkelbacteria bacterium]
MEQFDVIVIGAGSAGLGAAYPLAAVGRSVLVIERDQFLGGECPNYACIPTKSLLKAAKVYRQIKNAHHFGIDLELKGLNYRLLKQGKDQVVAQTGGRNLSNADLSRRGIKLIKGTAEFTDQKTIRVAGQTYKGDHFVVATGTSLNVPPIPGLNKTDFLTSRRAINLEELPESITILGAGPVGVEFATVFASFGSDVTLIQRDNSILSREEPEIAAIIHQSLTDLGVKIIVDFDTEDVSRQEEQILITGNQNGQELTVVSQKLMLATGTKPNLDDLKLDVLGVKTTKQGIVTDELLRSSVPYLWAAGDVSGHFLYTHTAHYEGTVVAQNILGHKTTTDYRVVPRVVFCEPELASVGQTEAQLTRDQRPFVVGRAQIGQLGRALTDRVTTGQVKIVVDPQSRLILGGAIASQSAGELIHELALAMKAKLTIDQLTDTIHAFPTYSEAVLIAAANAAKQLN